MNFLVSVTFSVKMFSGYSSKQQFRHSLSWKHWQQYKKNILIPSSLNCIFVFLLCWVLNLKSWVSVLLVSAVHSVHRCAYFLDSEFSINITQLGNPWGLQLNIPDKNWSHILLSFLPKVLLNCDFWILQMGASCGFLEHISLIQDFYTFFTTLCEWKRTWGDTEDRYNKSFIIDLENKTEL